MDDAAAAPPWVGWEDPDPSPPARRRPPWLLAVGLVPWLLVAFLLTRSDTPDGASTSSAHATPSAAVPTDPPVGGSTVASAGSAAGPSGHSGVTGAAVTTSAARTAVAEDDARAVATVVARAWLTGVGPRLDLGLGGAPAGDGYVEHLVVEAVDHAGPGAAVVTVLAVVLRTDDGTYDAATLHRLAVPLRFDADGARPAGPPYPLPATAPTPDPLEVEGPALTDPDLLLAAAEALSDAGYADVDVVALGRTAAWPLVVTARARAPGAGDTGTHAVWLREHLGRLVVAGSRPPRPDQEQSR